MREHAQVARITLQATEVTIQMGVALPTKAAITVARALQISTVVISPKNLFKSTPLRGAA